MIILTPRIKIWGMSGSACGPCIGSTAGRNGAYRISKLWEMGAAMIEKVQQSDNTRAIIANTRARREGTASKKLVSRHV